MSGIATATSKMVAKCTGTKAQVLETRKTVPGLRLLDKWAVLIGGGTNHRMGLFDMIMIKDNHIAAAGGLRQAVDQACLFVRSNPDRKIPVEVETRTLEEVCTSMLRPYPSETPQLSQVPFQWKHGWPYNGTQSTEYGDPCRLLRQ